MIVKKNPLKEMDRVLNRYLRAYFWKTEHGCDINKKGHVLVDLG